MSIYQTFSLLIAAKTIQQIIYFVYLFQLKEYRLDRLFEHLGRTQKEFIPSYLHLTLLAPLSIKKFPRPTPKVFLLLSLSLFIYLFSLTTHPLFQIYFLFFSFLAPLLALLLVLLPDQLFRYLVYKLASEKIKNHPNLTIIGITGSYGKSSTKNFLNQLLSSHFPTLSSPKNINTPLGISLFVLKNLNPKHRLLIVEISAYKKGEVKKICQIVSPQIGILTGIGNQHLALFGSQKKIIQAKSELFEALPSDGLALINFDHLYSQSLKPYLPQKYLYYSTKKKKDIYLDQLKPKNNQLFFTLHLGLKTHLYQTNLTFPYHLENLLPALYLAHHFGLPSPKIVKGLIHLNLPDTALIQKKGKKGSQLLLDLKNSTLNGTLSALDTLGHFPYQNKIAVLPCLIELGSQAVPSHQKIALSLKKNTTLAIITTPDYFETIKKTIPRHPLFLLTKTNLVQKKISTILSSQTAILLEGRLWPDLIKSLE